MADVGCANFPFNFRWLCKRIVIRFSPRQTPRKHQGSPSVAQQDELLEDSDAPLLQADRLILGKSGCRGNVRITVANRPHTLAKEFSQGSNGTCHPQVFSTAQRPALPCLAGHEGRNAFRASNRSLMNSFTSLG